MPPPEQRFKNSISRLERASLHRKTFESEFASLFEGEESRAIVGKNKGSGWWLIRLGLSAETIAKIKRNQLSLELGEFAYQLRSALDGLIWDTITYTQGSELPPDTKGLSRLEFPLSPEWKATDKNEGSFHGFPFPQNLIEWMRSIQPGTADKPVGHPDRGLQNTLEDIHNLARFDRHRRLRVVSMLPVNHELEILSTEPAGGGIVAHEWFDCDPLDGKYDVVRIRVVCPGGLFPYKLRLKPNLPFSIFVEDIEPYGGENIGVQLDRFIQAVQHVVDRFDSEFA